MTTTERRACGTVHPDDIGHATGVRACALAADHPTAIRHRDPVGNTWPVAPDGNPVRSLPDYEERMSAARRRAAWELGDSSWATLVIDAFADPMAAHADLDADGAPR